VTAQLSERDSGLVVWSQSYDRPLNTDTIFDVEAEVTAAITSQLAQVYGVINAAAATHLSRSRPTTLFAYDCVQRAFAYRRTFARELYPPVRACLEDAVGLDPNYATAWAMLAFAHLDAARFRLVEPDAWMDELRTGLEAARHAVALAPGSVTAQQSLAALQFGSGAYEEAEQAQRRAIALNPRNPESLAQLGWRLMARGRWEEGGDLLRQAIDTSVVVPAWYHETLALALYLGGNFQEARDEATLGAGNCCSGYATLALTEAALGNMPAAHQALEKALQREPLLARDPVAFWADFQGSPEVIERLNAGLAKAGLQPPPSTEAGPRS
jgi:tetratricopeptide (TPR) repeat protein